MQRKGTQGMNLGALISVNPESVMRESIRQRYVKSCGTSYIEKDLDKLRAVCKEMDIPFSTPIQMLIKDFLNWLENPKNKVKILAYIAKIRSEGHDKKPEKKKKKGVDARACGTSYIAEDLTRLKSECRDMDIPFSAPVQLLVRSLLDWLDNPKNKAKMMAYTAKIRSESDDAKINKKKAKPI